MDPALKQRLIGATVLVVLAVIFVPMLVEDTPRSDAEAIDLTIPPQPGQAFEPRSCPWARRRRRCRPTIPTAS